MREFKSSAAQDTPDKQGKYESMDQKIIVYHPNGDIRLEVKTGGETMWLTQEQMCRLFGRERSVITKHIGNSLKEGEID